LFAGNNLQEDNRKYQQGSMDQPLHARSHVTVQEVCVQVTSEQDDLKKEHTGSPDVRGTAKPWQDHLGNQWLDLEKQESAEKDRYSKYQHAFLALDKTRQNSIRTDIRSQERSGTHHAPWRAKTGFRHFPDHRNGRKMLTHSRAAVNRRAAADLQQESLDRVC
jgi:hypothetical protein